MLINKVKASKGFTLIEMLVVAPVVILAIGAFLTVIISMTGEVIASRASNNLTYNMQDALNRIEQDVKLSSTFLATNNVTLTAGNAQGYNDDATNFVNASATTGNALILNMVATNGNPLSSTSRFVFLKDQPNACTDPYDNIPLTYNVVYFVKNDTLWRRTVMPALYADTNYSCVVPWQQPSCSPTYMEAQTGSVFCKTSDIRLVDGVGTNDFTIEYYTGSNGTTPNTTASDSGASISQRSAALTSATTIRALISSSQNAGGRTVENSSNIRVSRLETNASAVATLAPATTPTAPVVSGQSAPGAKAVFTWPVVNGATGYTFEYNINGGAWQTGFTNQNTRTFTASANANTDTVNARVTAINSAGSSGYGTATVAIPLWEPLILQNGWVQYDTTYGVPAYTKTSTGVVLLKGFVKRTAAAVADEVFATLPVGYRPTGGRIVFGTSINSNVSGRVDIDTSGNLLMSSGSNVWTSLNMIRFVPAGAGTRTTATFLNGWTNAGGVYAPASSVRLSNNRIFTQGWVVPGTTTAGTRIFNPPSGSIPSLFQNFATRSNGGWGTVSMDHQAATQGIQIRATTSGNLSVTTNYIASTYTGTWTTPTLGASWVAVGGIYSTPQYTKSTDNLVTLKGRIRNGTTTSGTVVYTLPAGFRPKERLAFTVSSNEAHARVDVDTNGNVILMSGISATWLSLDGITFVAEQ